MLRRPETSSTDIFQIKIYRLLVREEINMFQGERQLKKIVFPGYSFQIFGTSC